MIVRGSRGALLVAPIAATDAEGTSDGRSVERLVEVLADVAVECEHPRVVVVEVVVAPWPCPANFTELPSLTA